MKTALVGLDGQKKGEVELPSEFGGEVRTDLIRRAVVASWKNEKQPFGSDPDAGNRSSAKWDGTRKGWGHGYNWSHSRLPRIMLSSGRRVGKAMASPNTVGGMVAFPPRVEKIWAQKINKKERLFALRSAIAATAQPEIVKARGHKFSVQLPIVVESKLDEVKTTKDLIAILNRIGVTEDLARAKTKVRSGRGKMRGRGAKTGKSVLIVSGADKGVKKAAANIPGVDFSTIKVLSVEDLAPGSHAGRLVIWSESAIAALKGAK